MANRGALNQRSLIETNGHNDNHSQSKHMYNMWLLPNENNKKRRCTRHLINNISCSIVIPTIFNYLIHNAYEIKVNKKLNPNLVQLPYTHLNPLL